MDKWTSGSVRSVRWLAALAAVGGTMSSAAAADPRPADPATAQSAQSAQARPGGRELTPALRRMMLAQMMERGMSYDEQGRPLAATCFVENPTPEQFDYIMQRFQALPPPLAGDPQNRYFTATTVWLGMGDLGSSGAAAPATLTYSFPADGVTWGDGSNGPVAPNNLNAQLVTLFGSLDRGREYIRQSIASWRRYGGLSYIEVADDNAPYSTGYENVATRGNVRIGSNPQGNTGVLGYNYFPGASDMTLNSDEFPASQGTMGTTANNYRYFRNVVAHEHGHGLGYIHPTPCNQTKLMEPFASTAFEMTQIDEYRGMGRNYGDRFAGNNSGAAAKDFRDLTTPSVSSIIEPRLSTNGTTGFNNSDEDWFRFTLSSTQTVTITVTPTGGSYPNGQQTGGCNPSNPATINTSQAGNLNIELRNGTNGVTVLQTASSAAAGSTETLSAGSRAAGTYWVRVFDVGPNGAQTVQLYDLTIRIGTSKAPPTAIAGLNKRVQANTTAQFMGEINSYTTDTGPGGGANSITTYAWDLNGDGTFEVANNPTPTRSFVSNGTYPATLRITDANGLTDTDTINVVVFGATTTVASASPSTGNTGQTVPITLNGANLKNLTSASQVTVSGTGVAVTGTPVPNADGTQVTGLSLVINVSASLGARNITVSNADGTGTGTGVFTVNSGVCVGASIATQPSSTTACTGASASFTVVPGGSAPHTFQWRKGLTNISGATAATFTINPVTAGDVGSYSCIVTNACGNATSNSVTLTVNSAPVIGDQPSSANPCQGNPVTFTMSATGTPAPTFQWRRNSVIIPGATSSTFSISSVTTGDSGSYDCVATNSCGSATTAAASLTVRTPASVSTSPSPQTVCEGTQTSMSVSAAGGGPYTYQWRRDGNNIAGAVAAIISISPVTPASQGSYDCVVSNACGSATSTPALLTVQPLPAISAQPASLSRCPGTGATFSVSASGDPPITYQWQKDGLDIGGATGPSYTIASVTPGDQASYACVVSNGCGAVLSAEGTLTVQTAVSISAQPAALTRCVGASASFSVSATGTPAPTFQWQKDGVDIGGATASTLTINPVSASDQATYRCVVTNPCGSVDSTGALLTVQDLPQITQQPAGADPCLGGSASLTVAATGPSPITYQWQRNSVNLSGATSPTLSINPVVEGSAGTYICIVTGPCGSTPSAAAVITVRTTPTIDTPPAPQSACVGGSAAFTVAASGPGPITYQWRLNTSSIGGATGPTYVLASAQLSDAGNYDCIVTNPCGSVTTSAAALTVNQAPAIGTQPAAQNVCQGAAATFSVSATGEAPITYQWRLNGSDIGGATAATYQIIAAGSGDVGSYDCLVSNACGSTASGAAALTIDSGPAIGTQPQPFSTCIGASASFSVEAVGTPPLTYQWRRDGNPIGGQTTGTLLLPVTVASDEASYDCIVTGPCGSTTSAAAALTLSAGPEITSPPAPITACIGDSAALTVVATGDAPITYQWRLDGADISGATSSTLSFASLAGTDEGSYDCVVTNPCGSTTSSAAAITLGGGPGIVQQPSAQTACEGENASFTVAASGASSFQWRRNAAPLSDGPSGSGSTISGATTASLTITGVSATDMADYDCVLTSSCGSTTTAAVALAVSPGVTITQQPVDTGGCTGASVSLSVTATGGAPLTYQWRRNGSPISGATSDTLNIASLAGSSAGSYDCIVTEPCESVTSNAAEVDVCLPDYNCSGVVSVQDIFDFMAGYFAGEPRADLNESGVISVQDIFDFLAAYFTGC